MSDAVVKVRDAIGSDERPLVEAWFDRLNDPRITELTVDLDVVMIAGGPDAAHLLRVRQPRTDDLQADLEAAYARLAAGLRTPADGE